MKWIRPKLKPEIYLSLAKKNDKLAAIHLMAHCLCIFITGSICSFLYLTHHYVLFALFLFLHGTIFTFLGWEGASHELIHNSVFTSRLTNSFFLYLFSFMTWNNCIYFAESHKKHHLFTLHKDEDCEYNFSYKPDRFDLMWEVTFNFPFFLRRLKILLGNSFGRLEGYWPNVLFEDKDKKRKLLSNSRMILIGHSVLLILFVYFHFYHLVFVVTLAPFFGNYLPRHLGRLQHIGLKQNSDDFRKCCRTVEINPVLEFFYWGMNYHIEHHIYPSIPFYNLKKTREYLYKQGFLLHD